MCPRHLPCILGTLVCAAVLATAPNARASTERPAASMRDLRDDLAACFRPPGTVANMRVTFYFSLNRAGGLIGPPRTTLLGFTGPDEKKIELLRQFQSAFGRCLPVPLNGEMAADIPGEVYFLQYIVGPNGVDEQVLLRPFEATAVSTRACRRAWERESRRRCRSRSARSVPSDRSRRSGRAPSGRRSSGGGSRCHSAADGRGFDSRRRG